MVCADQDFRFPLKADVYYATMIQDDTGAIHKSWVLGRESVPCEFRTDKFNSDSSFAINTKNEFFSVPLILFGRFREDIRYSPTSGRYVAISNILVTNISDFCTGSGLFLEAFKEVPGNDMNTVFEVKTFQPFTNPWGQVEYYKTQMFRMEDQNEIPR